MDGTYNKDNYKLLLDIFIKTNDVIDPNKIKGLNIPKDKEHEVQEMIKTSVNEYRETKGLPHVQSHDDEIDEHPTFNL
ncbi:MAG: hypothetical protein HRT87_10545 [Legionellales bacterium]|nr:hypothetical protein [Legionellales bacterium]